MWKKYVTVRLESKQRGSTSVAGVYHIDESDRGPGTLPMSDRPGRGPYPTRDVLVKVSETMEVMVVHDEVSYPIDSCRIDIKLSYDHIHSVDALHMVADAARAAVAPTLYLEWCQRQELAADAAMSDDYPIGLHDDIEDVDQLPLDPALERANKTTKNKRKK